MASRRLSRELTPIPTARSADCVSPAREEGLAVKIAVVYRPPALDVATYKATWTSDVKLPSEVIDRGVPS